MPEDTQPEVNSQEVKKDEQVVEEARVRADAFQKAYQALCQEYKCSHKAILNATQEGIFPAFVIVISKETEEEKSAEKSE